MNSKLEKFLREMPDNETSTREMLEAAIVVATDPTRAGGIRGPKPFFRLVGEILHQHKGLHVEAIAMDPRSEERAGNAFVKPSTHTLEDCMKCDRLDSCPEAAENLRKAGEADRKRTVH